MYTETVEFKNLEILKRRKTRDIKNIGNPVGYYIKKRKKTWNIKKRIGNPVIFKRK